MSTPTTARPQPLITRDTAFWWEGVAAQELRIQRCTACGQLRHPPDPGCWRCGSLDWDWITSGGRGVVHSYVVYHTPQLPAFEYPNVVVLVQLDEGVRIISNLVGSDPDDARIGLPVEVTYQEVGGNVLPQFRPVAT
jgi:uncharacterized OB-fold protein